MAYTFFNKKIKYHYKPNLKISYKDKMPKIKNTL